jgi:excisionase family DNA binding protein
MAVHSHTENSGPASDRDLIPIHISEVERLTGIGRSTLEREIREGRLAACRIGRQWHMTRSQITAWLKRIEVPARES